MKNEVLNNPESNASQKACAAKDFMIDRAITWTENHLSSCKSYRKNNHFGRRLEKWNKIYSRVLGCDKEEANPEEIDPEESILEESECGCYAEDEEIPIENNKCVFDLSEVSDVLGDWRFTFDLKINSFPDGPIYPQYYENEWFTQIIQGLVNEFVYLYFYSLIEQMFEQI